MLRQLRKMREREDGVTAIEFAILAVPLFSMIIGIIELGLFYAAGAVLEGASASAARMIRTGQVQEAVDPEAVFREELCDKGEPLLVCEDIQYEVIRVAEGTFAGAEDYEPQFDDDGNLIPTPFATGDSNDVVIIQSVYRYEFMTPFIGRMITGGSGDNNSVVHMATVVVKAEPYNFGED
jgi:Flp pilus assembly protein TadG